jgi:hypothetical protein
MLYRVHLAMNENDDNKISNIEYNYVYFNIYLGVNYGDLYVK